MAQDIAGGPAAIAVADVNGDTHADLVLALEKAAPGAAVSGDESLLVYRGLPNGSFQAGTAAPGGAFPSCLTALDLDGDALADLAVGSEKTGEVRLLAGRWRSC